MYFASSVNIGSGIWFDGKAKYGRLMTPEGSGAGESSIVLLLDLNQLITSVRKSIYFSGKKYYHDNYARFLGSLSFGGQGY